MRFFEGKDGKWMVIIQKGEEVMSTLTDFARQRKITGGMITGIGALTQVELGFYHLETKEYARKNFGEQEFELLGMHGNFSLNEGDYFTHLHVQLGADDYRCFGGHLFSAVSAVTVEVAVTDLGTKLERTFDCDIGLNLINS